MKHVLAILIGLSFAGSFAFGEETAKEKSKSAMETVKSDTKEAYQDTKKAAKKTYRKASDKTCEMINGKMECAAKKVKHSVQNGVDEVKDKAND